jgi:hypothetical protein
MTSRCYSQVFVALRKLLMRKIVLREHGQLWTPLSLKIHTYLDAEYFHSAWVFDVPSFRGFSSNHPRLSVCI